VRIWGAIFPQNVTKQAGLYNILSNIRGTTQQMNSKDREKLCDSEKDPLFRTLTLHMPWRQMAEWMCITARFHFGASGKGPASCPGSLTLRKQPLLLTEQEASSLLIRSIKILHPNKPRVCVLTLGPDLKSNIHGVGLHSLQYTVILSSNFTFFSPCLLTITYCSKM
jgi:hypothetical protein